MVFVKIFSKAAVDAQNAVYSSWSKLAGAAATDKNSAGVKLQQPGVLTPGED